MLCAQPYAKLFIYMYHTATKEAKREEILWRKQTQKMSCTWKSVGLNAQ